ncbi:MAG: hypothetical protein GC179_22650 [Anaerolineaceae bacterium]|nr:hypothetical protein [Anaerolineaceae bacterium]
MKQLVQKPLFWLALIMMLGTVPRVVNLERVPVGSDGDVAWYGINALDWVDRGVMPYYIRELYGAEPLSVYGIGAMIPLVGINQTTARLATALWNVMGIGLLYAAAYWLLADAPRRLRILAGLMSALAAAISLHAIFISRLGLPAPYIPAAVALLMATTAWARAKGKWWRWALAGAALALTQYIYIAARVIPLAVVVWFLHDALLNRAGFKTRWRGWMIMAVTAFILVSPNLYTYLTLPRAFFGRAEAAKPFSGALIWTFDTSPYGGPLALIWNKLVHNFEAVGIVWNYGPYTTELAQPILTPPFFVGFLLTLVILVRQPRRTAAAWLWLAMPLVLLPDLLTSATSQPHAMRQIDVLTFVFLLAGIGLAYGWEWVSNYLNATPTRKRGRESTNTALVIGLALVIAVPSAWDMYRYFVLEVPQQYADPKTSWMNDQASLDISRRIVSQPDQAYLIPYTEWERSTISWMTADVFRQRSSAITVDGQLRIDNPPDKLTILRPADPTRVRWDGTTAQVDDRLWVLLDKGRTLLLPPLTDEQTGVVKQAKAASGAEELRDRSDLTIAFFYHVTTPAGLFAPRQVVDNAADANFGDELHLAGYSVPNADLTSGQPFFVTLYWTTLKPPSEDYEIFVQLWNDQGQAVAQWQNVPFGAMYRTRIWRETEMLATHHWLQLPADAPVGRYRLVAGVYHGLKAQRATIEGSSADTTNNIAMLGNLRVPLTETPASLPAPPQVITLGGLFGVKGLGITVDDKVQTPDSQLSLKAGQTINLKLLWDVLKPPPVDYTLFLHLTPIGTDQPAAQVDRLIRPDYPTGAWRTGDQINDSLDFALPADLPEGNYELWLGVYYWQTNERLAIQTRGDGDVTTDQRLRLAELTIEGN